MPVQLVIEEKDVVPTMMEAIKIIINLRYFGDKFRKEYGAANKASLKYWENKADKLIKSQYFEEV